jgi:hypothetical protein
MDEEKVRLTEAQSITGPLKFDLVEDLVDDAG